MSKEDTSAGDIIASEKPHKRKTKAAVGYSVTEICRAVTIYNKNHYIPTSYGKLVQILREYKSNTCVCCGKRLHEESHKFCASCKIQISSK